MKAIKMNGHGGIALNVWDYERGAMPLLLCHCTGGLARLWDPVVARLDPRLHPYAIDSRGHGDSQLLSRRDDYAWENAGRDVLAVIDALGLPRGLCACGHSAGAAHIAYAEMLRPGAFSRVILIDAIIGPRAHFEGPSPLAEKSRRRKNEFDSRIAARDRLASKPPMGSWHPEALDAFIAHGLRDLDDGRAALKLPGPFEAFVYEQGGACDVFERLAELQFEALLVSGSESYGVPMIELQAQGLPHARTHIVPGASHFIPQEKPAEVAALIQEWLMG